MAGDLEEIKQNILRGDQSFLSSVYQNSLSYCRSYLIANKRCSVEEAEDIFMDSLLVLRNKIIGGTIQKLDNIDTFLVGVCINLQKEYVLKKYKDKNRESQVIDMLYSHNYEVSIEEKQEKELLTKIARMSMKTLGGKCQQIINLFHVEGLTMGEISDVMGFASPNVAKTLKSRCFQKLIKKANELRSIYK